MRIENETDIFCDPRINKGPVYYDPSKDRILHVVAEMIYFEPDMFYRFVSTKGKNNRRIRALWEIKENLNESGCEYLGEL